MNTETYIKSLEFSLLESLEDLEETGINLLFI